MFITAVYLLNSAVKDSGTELVRGNPCSMPQIYYGTIVDLLYWFDVVHVTWQTSPGVCAIMLGTYSLTYINYWSEHSSTGMQWPLQPQRYLPYGVRCNGLVLFFNCCRHLEQSRIDRSTALSTLRPQIAMVWSNFFFFSRNLELSRVHISSLPLAAFQRPNAQSSNLYRSVDVLRTIPKDVSYWPILVPAYSRGSFVMSRWLPYLQLVCCARSEPRACWLMHAIRNDKEELHQS